MKSTVIPGKLMLGLNEILRRADTALPDARITFINLLTKPDEVFEIYKKVPQNSEDFNSYVKLDQYSGKVLYVHDSRTSQALPATAITCTVSSSPSPDKWSVHNHDN